MLLLIYTGPALDEVLMGVVDIVVGMDGAQRH